MNWLSYAPDRESAIEDQNAVKATATAIPNGKAPFVRSVVFLADSDQYLINLDPGWLSGLRKSGQDAAAALAKAGYANATIEDPESTE